MSSLTKEKRLGLRVKDEGVVGIKTNTVTQIAYLIDISRTGVKVGTSEYSIGQEQLVEILIDKRGERLSFTGRVVREDGKHYIARIRRTTNTIFIQIDDERFSGFVNDHYYI